MKEIKLAYDNGSVKKTVTCFTPESWDEVTWKQLSDIQKVLGDESVSKMDKGLTRASILTGVALPVLLQCSFDELFKMMGTLDFTTKLPEPNIEKAIDSITIEGKTYHPVPLYTAADLTAYDKIEYAEELPFEEKAALKMAIFMRQELPKNLKWYQKLWPTQRREEKPNLEVFTGDGDLMEKRKKLLAETLTVTEVANLSAFFLKAVVESQLPILDFGPLPQALLRQNKKIVELCGRDMGGCPSGMGWRKLLWKLRQFYSTQSAKYLQGSNTTNISMTKSDSDTNKKS